MPTREEIMEFVRKILHESAHSVDDFWVALYCLLLD